ncbi:MAG: Ig-like domain-containing protein [Verrucomicrobiota bacterium]|jgi:predicted outer membrane repeat protein
MKSNLPLFWLAAVALLAQGACAATTLTVNTTTDTHSVGFTSEIPGGAGPSGSTASTDSGGNTSLRSALEYASVLGGAWVINLPVGTYSLSLGDLVVGVNANTTITIQGQGTSANTTINQTQTHRMVFVVNYNVDANVVFNLGNVTLSGGNENGSDSDGYGGNGGAILAGGSSSAPGNAVALTNVVFTGNTANGNANGGAISMTGGGNLTVANCTFSGNYAGAGGSGSGAGGAIYFDAGSNPGNVSINNSAFANNIAGGANGLGGAVYLAGGNTYTIDQCTFTGNTAATDGGAIYLASGELTASFNRITGNTAPAGSGSGLFVLSAGTGWADARNNWWGGNLGPNGTGGDSVATTTSFDSSSAPSSTTPPLSNGQVSFDPWLVLTHTANPTTILTSAFTTLTAGFTANSAGTPISASNLGALIGLPIAFNNPVNGALSSPQATIQAAGAATATFTAGATPGAGAADANVDNGTATASITIVGPPTANVQSVAVAQDTPKSIALTGSDPNSPPLGLTYTVTADPTHGTLSGTAPSLTYTPNAGYFGPDSFQFKVNNGFADSGGATVSLTVVGQPTASAQSVSTLQNSAVGVTLSGSDPDSPPLTLTYTVTATPTHGGLSGSAPNLTYTPNAGYTGPDSFQFKVNNGVLDSAAATVSVTVQPLPAVSLVVSGYPSPMTAGVAQTFTVTAKDSGGNTAVGYVGTVHFTSSDGQAALPSDYAFVTGDAGVHTFTATLKTAGTETLTATDTGTASITGTSGSVTVSAAAASGYRITDADSGTPAAGVGDALTITLVDPFGNPETGFTGDKNLTFSGLSVADDGTHPTVTDKNGTPVNLGTSTTITFASGVSSVGGLLKAYKAETQTLGAQDDASTPLSSTSPGGAPVSLTIANANPVASSPTYAHAPGISLKILLSDLLAGANDANHDTLSFASVATPSTGGATLFADSTYVYYTPNSAGNGDTFTYHISDGHGGTATGTVTVTVATPGGLALSIVASGGTVTITFFGIPGLEYDLQRATSLGPAPPANWATLPNPTQTASSSDGEFTFSDTPGSGTFFYRSLQH